MKVCFETFGCRLNKAEALQMEAEYIAKGWETTDKHKDADLFVVRGCSVTARAQHDCERLIAHLKRHYHTVPIRICGCFKSQEKSTLERIIRKSADPLVKSADTVPVPVPTRTARAYLKVQDGCAGKCTFCIVPKFRGPSTSVDFDAVKDQAKRFVEAGYHEIVVTGCNLSLYASQGKRLPDLLQALAQTDPSCRIRLGSLEPGECAMETLSAMAESANVCRFLHIPVQSGANRVLLAMRRPYVVREVDNLVTRAKELMPGLGLGCDLMTGFPGETELEFAATKGLAKRHGFNNAHVFPYSERPDTLAAGLPRAVPPPIRSLRARAISDVVMSARRAFAKSFIGKTVEIVNESENKCKGWTGEYLPCEAVLAAPRKALVKIFVTKTEGDRLIGQAQR